jgi:glutathione S-transferase
MPDSEKNILYILPGRDGLLSASPFCAKAETFLLLAGLPYKTEMGNPMKTKKGKLPVLQDTDGVMVDDSRFIIKHLVKKYNLTIDDQLDAKARAKGHIMQRLCEESLYFYSMYFAFIDDNGWAIAKEGLEKQMPPVIRSIIPPLIRRSIRKALYGQGTGRQSQEEIKHLAFEDLDALAEMIGEGPYALGEKISSYDASIGAFVASWVVPKRENPLGVYARSKKELVAYNERIQSLIRKDVAAPVK